MNTIHYTHENLMTKSVLCTIFCCLITGFIAIINASKANECYTSSMVATDETAKNNLLFQAQESNKKAKNMITLSIILGVVYIIISVMITIVIAVFG